MIRLIANKLFLDKENIDVVNIYALTSRFRRNDYVEILERNGWIDT